MFEHTFNCFQIISINNRNSDGDTPLIWSARVKKHDCIKLLLDNGADVDAKNDNGWTALYFTVYENNYDMTKYLLEHGADVNIVNRFNETVIYTAIINKHKLIDNIESVIKNKTNINDDDLMKLHSIIYEKVNRENINNFLLEHNVDSNIIDEIVIEINNDHDKLTSYQKIIDLLVAYGADKNIEIEIEKCKMNEGNEIENEKRKMNEGNEIENEDNSIVIETVNDE